MSSAAAGDEFSRLTSAIFRLILTMDDARGAMGERLGIGVTGLKTLSILNRLGPISAGELAKTAGITSGSMTATIDKLENRGLATRKPSPFDRRSIVVGLTAQGTETMQWVLGHYFEALGMALPEITEIDSVSCYLESTAAELHNLSRKVPELPRS